jgi:formylglycine-generating enzyme
MRWFLAFTIVLFVACAAAAPPEPVPAGPPTPSAIASTPDASAPDAAAAPVAQADAGVTQPDESGACPEGMKLVDGDYCDDVDYKCVREWYAKWNKKVVCEEFEAKSTCVGSKAKKRYCIDTYEYPNVKGERPEVMNRFHQAQVKCAALGKRMCTESEWNLACEGPQMKPFPNGYVRDPNKCNGDHLWDGPDMKKVARRDPEELARLWKGVKSGSQPECVSDYGVADMPANADEVVASEQFTRGDFRGKYDSVHTGGPWYEGVRNQCRPKVYTHDEGFYYYFLSFRCCAEADGKVTDPRTPMQKSKNWKMDKVERLAGFTVAQMKEKNVLKKQGKCECKSNDIDCKTMCGTLLGPKAKDADPSVKRGGRYGAGAKP